jgi:cation transport ATPase
VGAAYLWSLWALFFTDAGMTGMRMPFDLFPGRSGAEEAHLYLEVAAAVTTFIIAGRYFEAKAKRTSGAACGPCSTWAPRTSPYCETAHRARSRSGCRSLS